MSLYWGSFLLYREDAPGRPVRGRRLWGLQYMGESGQREEAVGPEHVGESGGRGEAVGLQHTGVGGESGRAGRVLRAGGKIQGPVRRLLSRAQERWWWPVGPWAKEGTWRSGQPELGFVAQQAQNVPGTRCGDREKLEVSSNWGQLVTFA